MEGPDLMEDPGSKSDAGRPKVVLAAWRLAIMAGPRKSIDVVEVDLRLRLGRHSWPQIARAAFEAGDGISGLPKGNRRAQPFPKHQGSQTDRPPLMTNPDHAHESGYQGQPPRAGSTYDGRGPTRFRCSPCVQNRPFRPVGASSEPTACCADSRKPARMDGA